MTVALWLGALLAVGALAFVLQPLFFPPEQRFVWGACGACGSAVVETDAVYCSRCGQRLTGSSARK